MFGLFLFKEICWQDYRKFYFCFILFVYILFLFYCTEFLISKFINAIHFPTKKQVFVITWFAVLFFFILLFPCLSLIEFYKCSTSFKMETFYQIKLAFLVDIIFFFTRIYLGTSFQSLKPIIINSVVHRSTKTYLLKPGMSHNDPRPAKMSRNHLKRPETSQSGPPKKAN